MAKQWKIEGVGPEGETTALNYRTGGAVHVQWARGKITSMATAPRTEDAAGRWIAPTLFDLQINGYAGVDFQQDNLSAADLARAGEGLRRDGCARFFFTLITAEWPVLLQRLRRARELRQLNPQLSVSIAGWHIEGPFLSDQPGFCGAHNAGWMLDPTPERIRELREAAGDDPLLLTLAPERSGAIEAIRLAGSLGITISLGHTNASADILREAVAAGATGFTHLGNGCPRELDRHSNIIWRVCDMPGLTSSLIPDGIHLPETVFRTLHRAAPRLYYTTDAMAAAGAPPGRYSLGGLELEVGKDQVVRQPGKPNFAGSALRPVEGVFRAARMLAAPWQDCWERLAEGPARLVGLSNCLGVGSSADFYLVSFPAPE